MSNNSCLSNSREQLRWLKNTTLYLFVLEWHRSGTPSTHGVLSNVWGLYEQLYGETFLRDTTCNFTQSHVRKATNASVDNARHECTTVAVTEAISNVCAESQSGSHIGHLSAQSKACSNSIHGTCTKTDWTHVVLGFACLEWKLAIYHRFLSVFLLCLSLPEGSDGARVLVDRGECLRFISNYFQSLFWARPPPFYMWAARLRK